MSGCATAPTPASMATTRRSCATGRGLAAPGLRLRVRSRPLPKAARARMRVLTVNAGSSSLKLALLDERDETIAARELAAPRSRVDTRELRDALGSELAQAEAIGHRIVHGGARFRGAVRIDAQIEAELRGLSDLAPLHQQKSLAALDAAATYALPAEWRERWGLRRYGFHGLSHAWVARRAPQLLRSDAAELRIVSCHLGAGASLCAIDGGVSRDTTMGFTPLEGLVMATRAGSVDPGMLLWLMERADLSAGELTDALEHRSGLLALAGSADMRAILARAGAGEQDARLALEV